MRRLAVVEFLTLDGVMQGLGSPDEDRDGGFAHGGWGAAYADSVLGEKAGEGLSKTSAYLFGRRTYQAMAAHWPFVSDEDPIAANLNRLPKYVATTTLTSLDWAGAHVLAGDVVASVEELKADGEGFITVLGSGELVQTLIAPGLSMTTACSCTHSCSGRASGSFARRPGRSRCGWSTAPRPRPASCSSATSRPDGGRAQVPRQRTTSSATAIWTALS